MGQLHPLLSPTDEEPVSGQAANVLTIETARCGLCGASLKGSKLKFHMVSPRSAGVTVTVCRTCNRAAVSEGYRPAG